MHKTASAAIALSLSLLAMITHANPRSPATAAAPQRVFISGHSLTDLPFPEHLASVAQSLGTPLDWQRQYLVGSSIKDRARGRGADSGWAGYRAGDNRTGSGLDVVSDLKRQPYDVLLITEQHGLVDALVWHDTVRHLRHYHDRFIVGNPKGQTYFYEPWLGIPGRTDIQRWLAYERRAAPIWRCVVARVNHALESEGRQDRVASLPAGLALAELVERATQGAGLEGITEPTRSATLQRLFRDDVHVTALGFYYLALVSHGVMSARPLQGAGAAEGVSPVQARTLQVVASEFVARYRKETQPATAQDCAKALDSSFLDLYFDHRRDEYWAQNDANLLAKTWKRWRSEATLRSRLRSQNPLLWAAGSQEPKDYWFAPP